MAMQKTSNIVDEAQEYCRKTGISLATLAVRALGNSRFFGRHERRMEKIEEDSQRLRAFMAANPAEPVEQKERGAA